MTKSGGPWALRMRRLFTRGGPLQPFRLLRHDVKNVLGRYASDWTLFNQQIFASAVYVFFTNLLPGITFASDLYVYTGQNWGTVEVVFSTALCGIIFSLWVFALVPVVDGLLILMVGQLLRPALDHPWRDRALLHSRREHIFIM